MTSGFYLANPVLLTDAFALLGIALVLYAAGLRLLRWLPQPAWLQQHEKRHPFGWTGGVRGLGLGAGFVCLVLVLLAWPVGDAQLPLAGYVRGISGDLSVSLVLLALLDGARCWLPDSTRWLRGFAQEFKVLAGVVAAAAVVLYPLALGIGNWDPYRLGWPGNAAPLLIALLLLCCVCLLRFGLWLLPALVALAALGWSAGLLESTNLWDYLLDPWLALLCLAYTLRWLGKTCFYRGMQQ